MPLWGTLLALNDGTKPILGLAPLLQDAFFIAMAVTIMFGLGFATVLTLIVVPVLFTIFYRVPSPVP